MNGWSTVTVLVVICAGAYAVNEGVFFGSSVEKGVRPPPDAWDIYTRECRYLFPSGINVDRRSYFREEEARNDYCTFFKPKNSN
jgi:hypothetical protein